MTRRKKDLNLPLAVVKFLAVALAALVLLLASSGKWNWAGAWVLFIFDLLYMTVLLAVGRRYFPETLQSRAESKYIHAWDKGALIVYGISYYSEYLIAGLDLRFTGGNFHPALFAAGTAVYAAAMGITFWAFSVNPFASGASRLQKEKRQKVITAGPYRFIRHPMYFSIILFSLAAPFILGSFWALLPIPAVIGAFLFRCRHEDDMLLRGLPGYKAYARKVRFRMIPFVW